MLHRQLQGEASNTKIKSLGQSIKEEVRRVKETSKRVKKTDVGAKESNQKGWKLPKRRRQHVVLASSVEEIANLACNIVPLGRQTVGLVEKTTISLNAASPLTETGRMV